MTSINIHELEAALQAVVRGEVFADPLRRGLYATDASIYQVMPDLVVVPYDAEDVAHVVRLARRARVPILARGGGTSLAGQVVGVGIQLDFSKYMQRMLEINPAEGWAWVEPGIVLDSLNAQLAPYDLKFAPDVSPSNRATIGGMIGNNSSGMYSVVYGKTIDHVLELKLLLTDGSIITTGPLDAEQLAGKLHDQGLEGRCYRVVRRLAREHAEQIERYFPKIMRRVGGYNLDAFVAAAASQPTAPFDLTKIVVGSEGTLGLIVAAKVRLVPRPKQTVIGILAFDSLETAFDAVVPCLECQPAAVEFLDEILLDVTRRSPEYAKYLAQFVTGEPGALLQVEFFGETLAEAEQKLNLLEQHLATGYHLRPHLTRAITAAQKHAVLQVRKAGLPLLQSMSPDRKPETFVEDSAVAPEKLAAYIRRFRAICQEHQVQVALYGHASVGLIHARPLLNLKDPQDVVKLRSIAVAIKDLVIEFGGALSGEHGDGRLRAEFNPEFFGEQLYAAFREIKQTFDPYNMLNPGKIVDAPPMDTDLRFGANYHAIPLTTHYRFHETGGMAGAVELCNGNGLCRKTNSGTMCPSYMATRDEEHSTRGRANALRLVFAGVLPVESLTSERMKAAMDLCLECKGCTAECPSRVNMTRLKSEWLAHYYQRHGVPLRARLFGNIRRINQLGSAVAPFANRLLRLPGVAQLHQRLFGISAQRRLPQFAAQSFRRWFQRQRLPTQRPQVVLFPDTFIDYNEPEIGKAAVKVLTAAGFQVVLPARVVCCGRPQLSKGLLTEAKTLAQAQLEALWPYVQAGLPIIGLEPSCILSFRDEYPDLVDDPRMVQLAQQSFLFDEFVAQHRDQLVFRTEATPSFLLHGHCHQKALVGSQYALQLLRSIPGATVQEVDSGCCGMAGSFGYEAEHYELSIKIGERALFPAIRQTPTATNVVAMGASCRQQIQDGTGRRARHLAEVLAEWIDPPVA